MAASALRLMGSAQLGALARRSRYKLVGAARPITRLSGEGSAPSTAPRVFRRETRVERGGFCGGWPASGGCPRAWAAASTRYGGRGIQTTRSSADSSDDVVKNGSGGPSAAALTLPWYWLERRGADGTDLAGRSSGLAGRDGDELDVYGRAPTHGLEHADVNVLTGIARRPLKAL